MNSPELSANISDTDPKQDVIQHMQKNDIEKDEDEDKDKEDDQEEFVVNTKCKRIFDVIHGDISLSNLACMIIDTPYFQRLRQLHQLGTCYLVFPNGNHSRFEHSIGTYHVAGMILDCILKNTSLSDIDIWLSDIDELTEYYEDKYSGKMCVLDAYVCELIKIAALCHDIGHGPFSHIFDDAFLPAVKPTLEEMDSHENRSGAIIEYIIKTSPELSKIISQNEINFIKNLINPKSSHIGFVYQIVSNNLNGLDVDKYDYISRDVRLLGKEMHFDFSRLVNEVAVVDNIICYPEQFFYEIITMFQTRYRLHKQVYSHKAVISTQFMLIELMLNLDPILNISNCVNDVEKFCVLTDDYILTSVDVLKRFSGALTLKQQENLNKADAILQQIRRRDIYARVDTATTTEAINIKSSDFSNLVNHVTKNKEDDDSDIECTEHRDKNTSPHLHQSLNDSKIDLDKIIVYKTKIGLISGNKKNPLDHIYFYKTKQISNMEHLTRISMKKETVSRLISNTYQEYVTMIYYKDKHDIDAINLIRDEFRRIMHIKTQTLTTI